MCSVWLNMLVDALVLGKKGGRKQFPPVGDKPNVPQVGENRGVTPSFRDHSHVPVFPRLWVDVGVCDGTEGLEVEQLVSLGCPSE